MFRLFNVIYLAVFFISFSISAEVDKIYHPYVEYNIYEFEARLINQQQDALTNGLSLYRFGFGRDINEKFFLEFYIIGEKNTHSQIDIEAYEIEALYQIGEQGEYWADWGILVEIEKENRSKEWEGSFGLLFEKEFGRFSVTANYHQQYFYHDDVKHLWTHNSALQLRYRMQSSFEPAFEVYSSEDSFAMGPSFLGQIKFLTSKINWEIGLMKEKRHSQQGSLLRALLEYEF